ncbi:MAG: S24 family peptidase [Thermodesulfobacteriota bacterium]
MISGSMLDLLQPGDWAMVDTKLTDIVNGQLYAIRLDNQCLIERLHRRPEGRIEIVSENRKKYLPQEVEGNDNLVIGRAVWMCRELYKAGSLISYNNLRGHGIIKGGFNEKRNVVYCFNQW